MPANFEGPVKETHWVYPSLLCGMSAGRMTAKELVSLVATAGVDTFVCLQESYNEYGVDDYRQTLRQRLMGPSFGGKRQKAVRFLHCPVPDFGVLHDASLLALVGELQKAMAGGHVLYVHCMGGHGRTGTIVANLISAVDGVDFPTAMRKLQRRHRGRRGCRGGRCSLNSGELEDESQTEQAIFMQGPMRRQHKIATARAPVAGAVNK
jgi:hypothetical protein